MDGLHRSKSLSMRVTAVPGRLLICWKNIYPLPLSSSIISRTEPFPMACPILCSRKIGRKQLRLCVSMEPTLALPGMEILTAVFSLMKQAFYRGLLYCRTACCCHAEAHPGATILHDPRLIWNTQEIVQAAGGKAVMTKTGHAFIKEKMRQEEAVYGGEMSAHHYFQDIRLL